MSLPPVARRSLALAATTALLTSGLAGLAPGTAYAAAGTVTSVSPSVTNNSGDTAVTVNGSGFNPLVDVVEFALRQTSAYGAGNTPNLELSPDPTPSTTALSGTLGTTNAAPGDYDVYDSGTTDGPKCQACFTIASSGSPVLTGVAPGVSTGQTGRGAGALDLTGSNLARASFVTIYQADGVTPDPGLTFTVRDPNASSSDDFPGYASSSLVYGNYGFTANAFTPGKHIIRVKNTIGEEGAGVEFWQPRFAATGVSPTSVGAGVQNVVVTVQGVGIRQGSRLNVANVKCSGKPTGTCSGSDVTVGTSTVSADGTSISAPVTFTGDARSDLKRAVGISGPDGGSYSVGNVISVAPAPVVTGLAKTKLGQGASLNITVNGTDFATGTAGKPVFTFSGSGVTAQTLSNTNIAAVIAINVAPDAALGGRSITVTNPDGGSSTTTDVSPGGTGTPPLTITAGPKATKATPASATPSQTKTITVTGSGFDTSNGVTVLVGQPQPAGTPHTQDPTLTVSNVSAPTATSVTFTLATAANAPFGPRDIVIANKGDFGQVVCYGCFGVDSLTVSPTAGTNSGVKQVTFTGSGITQGSTVRLTKVGDATIQPDIVGTATTVAGDGTSIQGSFDLTDAATGLYNGVVTLPGNGGTLSCSSCFSVTSNAPTFTSIVPAGSGQGAVDRPFTITGTNFSHGMVVTIAGTSVHDLQFVDNKTLTGKLDVPSDTATGKKDVKVANNDASQSVTATGAYTISAPPVINSVSPASYGQGAQNVQITVTGTDFIKGSTPDTSSKVDFGPGVTVQSVAITLGQVLPAPIGRTSDDELVATVTIDPAADPVARDVTVTNPDGGVGIKAKSFTVNAGPKVTGISPQFLKPDASDVPVTITGSNFSTTSGKTAVPTIPNVTLSSVTVTATQITATAKVDSGAALGARDVTVTNPTDSGVGTCDSCLLIADVPGAPTNVHATATSTTVTAMWTAPTDDGGAPITNYVVSAKDPAGKDAGDPATVDADATSGTVTGLTSGIRYSIYVRARNVAGDSDAGSTVAQTTGTPPAAATVLTSAHSPSLSTTGDPVTLSGRLIQVNTGAGVAGATVELALVPDVGSATFPKLTTNANGNWSYVFRPVYSETIKTVYRGDSSHAATQAKAYRMGVSTRVTVTSPKNGARSSASSPLVVTGGTSPNKTGVTITLYRYSGGRYIAVQNVVVSSSGSYRFSVNLAKGNYTLKVGIGKAKGNFVGYSPAFGIHRV